MASGRTILDIWRNFGYLIKRFGLTRDDRALFDYLLRYCNDLGRDNSKWDRPFSVSNAEICFDLGWDLRPFRKSRDRLIKAGAIEFTPGGNQRGQLGSYCFGVTPANMNKRKTGPNPGNDTGGDPPKETDNTPYKEIQDLWNSICGVWLPEIKIMSETRKEYVRERFADWGGSQEKCLSTARQLFEKVTESGYLMGESERGWRATFDWLMGKPDNWIKVMEGNYSAE